MKPLPDRGVEYFINSNNCAQSVLKVFSGQFGLNTKLAGNIALGFGAGMGRQQTCGAVTGAYMVIGLLTGAEKISDEEKKELVCKRIREFTHQFERKHRFTDCRSLITIDLNYPFQVREAQEQGVFEHICQGLISDAIKIIDDLTQKNQIIS